MIQAIALLNLTFAATISTDRDASAIIRVSSLVLGVLARGFTDSHRVFRRDPTRLLLFKPKAGHSLQFSLEFATPPLPFSDFFLHPVEEMAERLLDDLEVRGGLLGHVLNDLPAVSLDHKASHVVRSRRVTRLQDRVDEVFKFGAKFI